MGSTRNPSAQPKSGMVLMRWLARSGDRDAVAIGRFALVIAVLIMTFIVGSNIVCLVAA